MYNGGSRLCQVCVCTQLQAGRWYDSLLPKGLCVECKQCSASHRQRLFENLRMLPHAPGVQMQAIPEDAVQEDSGDEEEDDPNKRISSETLRRRPCPSNATRRLVASAPRAALDRSSYDRFSFFPSSGPRQADSMRGRVLRLGR